MKPLQSPLTDEEPGSLEAFVATLEGLLVALAIGPETVLPSQWLPWVWDMHEGRPRRNSRAWTRPMGSWSW